MTQDTSYIFDATDATFQQLVIENLSLIHI